MDYQVKPCFKSKCWSQRLFIKFASEYVYKKELELPITINKKIVKDFINYVQNYSINHIVPGELELADLKDNLYDKYVNKNSSKNKKYKTQQESSYIIVDAHGWMRVKNGFGKTIRMIPPQKHNLNTGEYYYDDTRKIIPESKLNNTDFNYLSSLTKNIEDYFDEVKVLQYNDRENIQWIENALLREMSVVLGNEKEKIKVSLYNDIEYLKAAELILDQLEYNRLIFPENLVD